jgi:hypothetical protein
LTADSIAKQVVENQSNYPGATDLSCAYVDVARIRCSALIVTDASSNSVDAPGTIEFVATGSGWTINGCSSCTSVVPVAGAPPVPHVAERPVGPAHHCPDAGPFVDTSSTYVAGDFLQASGVACALTERIVKGYVACANNGAGVCTDYPAWRGDGFACTEEQQPSDTTATGTLVDCVGGRPGFRPRIRFILQSI